MEWEIKHIICIVQVLVQLVIVSLIHHGFTWMDNREKSYAESLSEYLFERSFLGLITTFAILIIFIILGVLIFTQLLSL